MGYNEELNVISTWVKAVAQLPNMRLREAPAKVARPVILWENPSRGKDRDISRYTYVNKVIQFGKLFVSSVEQANDLQEKLLADLQEKGGVLPIYNTVDGQQVLVGRLKQVDIKFRESDNLNIPVELTYEVTYGRTRPAAVPAATTVTNKVTTNY